MNPSEVEEVYIDEIQGFSGSDGGEFPEGAPESGEIGEEGASEGGEALTADRAAEPDNAGGDPEESGSEGYSDVGDLSSGESGEGYGSAENSEGMSEGQYTEIIGQLESVNTYLEFSNTCGLVIAIAVFACLGVVAVQTFIRSLEKW